VGKLSDIDKVLANLRDQMAVLQHSINQIEAARVKRPKATTRVPRTDGDGLVTRISAKLQEQIDARLRMNAAAATKTEQKQEGAKNA
jgi:hypothetical protein